MFDGFTKGFKYKDLETGCLFNLSFSLLTAESERRGALWESLPGMVLGTAERGRESVFLLINVNEIN